MVIRGKPYLSNEFGLVKLNIDLDVEFNDFLHQFFVNFGRYWLVTFVSISRYWEVLVGGMCWY